ncbi:MAG: pentapeptide repeat-containing protein [Polyangiaceae bacterium]
MNEERPAFDAGDCAEVVLLSATVDAPFRDALARHLHRAAESGHLRVWHTGLLRSGDIAAAAIEKQIASAHIVVPLVSADLFASPDLGESLVFTVRRQRAGRVRVVPLRIRSAFMDGPLAEFQSLPMDGEPIGRVDNDSAFADVVQALVRLAREIQPAPERSSWQDPSVGQFLRRVEQLCHLRERGCEIRSISASEVGLSLWEIQRVHEDWIETSLLAALPSSPSPQALAELRQWINWRYRRDEQHVRCTLVHAGDPVAPAVRRAEGAWGIRIQTLTEYNRLIDFRLFLSEQSARLQKDPVYPPAHYVPSRAVLASGGAEIPVPSSIDFLTDLLTSEGCRFVLVVAPFGSGKTFLVRELARRLGGPNAVVTPVLLDLRQLEKQQSVEALLAAHFVQQGMYALDMRCLLDLVERGKVVLLFDGFDELVQRVSYARAADHLDMLVDAARGEAKIVVTSRAEHFLSDGQMKSALARRTDGVVERQILKLLPLAQEEIHSLLARRLQSEQAARQRLDLIRSVRDLLGLAENPRMLRFISDIEEAQLLAARDCSGSITAARLYEALMERWLGHEHQRAHPAGTTPALDAAGRWRSVMILAEHLWGRADRRCLLAELPPEIVRDIQALAPPQQDREVTVHQVGSGTLLVRDAEGRFSFLHSSVLEFAVASRAAAHLLAGREPRLLALEPLTELCADFFVEQTGRERALAWATRALSGALGDVAQKNGRLVMDRLRVAPGPVVLSHKDLRGQDFSRRALRGADFSHCDLTEASFAGADLTGATLVGATFRSADLTRALLTQADLRGADLAGALMMGADLREARLSGAVFRQASLVGARVRWSDIEPDRSAGAAPPSPARFTATLPDGPTFSRFRGANSTDAREKKEPWRHWCRSLSFVGRSRLSCDFSPPAWALRGQRLAWALDRGVLVEQLEIGAAEKGSPEVLSTAVYSREPMSAGRLSASRVGDRTITIRTPETAAEQARIDLDTGGPIKVAFFNDGKSLVVASPTRISIFSCADGARLHRYEAPWSGDRKRHRIVAFSPSGHRIMSTAQDSDVIVLDTGSGRLVRRFAPPPFVVESLGISENDDSVALGGQDGTLVVHGPDGDISYGPEGGHATVVSCVAFSADGAVLASGGWDNTVRLWSARSGENLAVLIASPKGWAAFRPDGKYKSGGDPGGLFVHRVEECTFRPGALDPFLPAPLRAQDSEPLFEWPVARG